MHVYVYIREWGSLFNVISVFVFSLTRWHRAHWWYHWWCSTSCLSLLCSFCPSFPLKLQWWHQWHNVMSLFLRKLHQTSQEFWREGTSTTRTDTKWSARLWETSGGLWRCTTPKTGFQFFLLQSTEVETRETEVFGRLNHRYHYK